MKTDAPRTRRPLTDREISKFLSLVLRHAPERIAISLDPQEWVETTILIRQARRHGQTLDLPSLQRVVRDNDKQRFTLSPDGTRIRAAQGHSIAVDLALPPAIPPAVLWHGMARHAPAWNRFSVTGCCPDAGGMSIFPTTRPRP
ncbi:RNA 2'-phosphotransferase [Novacetimonas hansenii]|uniref:RNA 2'-phosphotransferase n=1 Tax=Novacetimonas hansenii TaxID=436 RepID=UPI00079AFC62|nr:RNA 2'-phosphotransferase [Novacetimonas hansenii]WEQ60210.1 RNA 2'-phosphotransferase [Novacetimonas hansenii]CUW46435.1 RNA 2'-phosphotransferase [Novacetimonas hansenii]